MKFLLTSLVSIIFLFGGVAAKARELMLVDKGRSNFVIAIPSTKDCPRILHNYYRKAALELQGVIDESTKVKLPVVEDSEIPAGKSAINIGPTVEARQLGLDKKKLDVWEVLIKKSGKNIFLYGKDKIYRKKTSHYRNVLLGSVRATTLFMSRFLGVRYLMPTRSGRYVPKLKSIALPGDLDLKDKPLLVIAAGGIMVCSMTWQITLILCLFMAVMVGIRMIVPFPQKNILNLILSILLLSGEKETGVSIAFRARKCKG